MKRIYTLLLMLFLAAGFVTVSCADSDMDANFDEILNETDRAALFDQRFDPTNPNDSTYDPFPDGN